MSAIEPDIQIVPIAEEHIEGFYKCLDAVARERAYLAFLQAPPLESTRDFVLSNIASDVPQFVAIVHEEVVGWCDISPKKLDGFKHCGGLGMGVLQPYRKLGVGQKLISRAIQRAREIGLERIELEVFASNTAAIRLYEKVGFVTEGIKRKARKIDGRYDDNVEMALFI